MTPNAAALDLGIGPLVLLVAARAGVGLAILVVLWLIARRVTDERARLIAAEDAEQVTKLAIGTTDLGRFAGRLIAAGGVDPATRHKMLEAAMLGELRGPGPLAWIIVYAYAAWSTVGAIGAGAIDAVLDAISGFERAAGAPPAQGTALMAKVAGQMPTSMSFGLTGAAVGVLCTAAALAMLEYLSAVADRRIAIAVTKKLGWLDYPYDIQRRVLRGRHSRIVPWIVSAALAIAIAVALPVSGSLPPARGTYYFTATPAPDEPFVALAHFGDMTLPESSRETAPQPGIRIVVGDNAVAVDDRAVIEIEAPKPTTAAALNAPAPPPTTAAPWPRGTRLFPTEVASKELQQVLRETVERRAYLRDTTIDYPQDDPVLLAVDANQPFATIAPFLTASYNAGLRPVQALTRRPGSEHLAGTMRIALHGPAELLHRTEGEVKCPFDTPLLVSPDATWQEVIAAADGILSDDGVALVAMALGTPGAPDLAEDCYELVE